MLKATRFFVDEDGREYAAALTENLTAAVIRGVTLRDS